MNGLGTLIMLSNLKLPFLNYLFLMVHIVLAVIVSCSKSSRYYFATPLVSAGS
jgi:hypothetical protein